MPREDCNVCGRPKSLSITYEGTQKQWHCFGVNCNNTGKTKVELTLQLIENLKPKKKQLDLNNLIDARSSPEALEYLRKNNAAGSTAKILYNIKDSRVVFNYKDLYVGRSLDSHNLPKWYNYTNTDKPFVVQESIKEKTKSVVLVEDCASACNASTIMDAIALLGTTLKPEYLKEILQYDKIYIALDEDATNKSMIIYDTLSLIKECKIIILKKDLKYCTLYELEDILK